MAAEGAGKRQVLFGVGAIHELPLPQSDLFGHGPTVVRAIHESPIPVVGWDNGKYQRLCLAFVDHPWRLSKNVTGLFDGLATQISQLLYPGPSFSPNGSFERG